MLKSSSDTNNDDVFSSNAPSFKMKSKIQGLQNAINTKSALEKGYIPRIIIFSVWEILYYVRTWGKGQIKWPFFIEASLDGSGKNQKS